MTQLYSKVNIQGFVVLSLFTTDPNTPVGVGERLLADSPPNPPEYTPGVTKPIRVEPVPITATKIPYTIVEDTQRVVPEPVNLDPFAGD